MSDIEDIGTNLQDTLQDTYLNLQDNLQDIGADLLDLVQNTNKLTYSKVCLALARKYKITLNKRQLSQLYYQLHQSDPVKYPLTPKIRNLLMIKSVRSDSGILNVSVSLPPFGFHPKAGKCKCLFCPDEPNMPKSYLSNEDVFKRAACVNFDAVKQVHNRLDTLKTNGHPIDKIEFRVLGGTFAYYDHQVTDQFIRDLYYAVNIYQQSNRQPLSLEEEQHINETALIHVVGLGIETRPDEITELEIIRFRQYGVTRVEIGVQHTDDKLLQIVNRGHTLIDSKRAIKLLKDYGFKVEIHIMPDLPNATPEGDMDCYRQILRDDPDLIPDYLKDYPCLDVSYTTIKKWKQEGRWKPYAEHTPDARELKEVLIYRQSITPKWVRVNRIQRDFPCVNTSGESIGYLSNTVKSNLGEIVTREAESRGIYCQCIRCREIRDEQYTQADIQYITSQFPASQGLEYFISAEIQRDHRSLLLGFIRLRITSALQNSIIPELKGNTGLIRELHVYGRLTEVNSQLTEVNSQVNSKVIGAQHIGIGKHLLYMAEQIAKSHQQSKMAIISGIGVREYYQKNGYQLVGTYMIKSLDKLLL